MIFAAVILAGGKSSRMGFDKALLEVDGVPLLARQIQIVRAAGAGEVFISGRSEAGYSAFGCAVLQDNFADSGPMAGIEAALEFVNGHKLYPKSIRAADTMLLLGKSLAGIPEREAACQTFAAALKQYPQMTPQLRQRIVSEQSNASC